MLRQALGDVLRVLRAAQHQIPRSHILTIEQAAQALGVTPRMIRRLTASRQLPYVKVGRLVRIRDTDIAQCVEEWTVPSIEFRRTPRCLRQC
ncbi:MAG: helix-turn-helix domain-containing protein [Actinomycetota bacterium]|nr:helix-turn-helix domain-containing protein [Actinomycetota bacterium]